MNRNLKIVLIIIAGILVAITTYLLIFFISATDSKNIDLEGYVYDSQTKLAIKDAIVTIENYRYESNGGKQNYDEYLGKDNFELITNENGYYKIEISKSAFIVIEVKKEGYKSKTESEYSSKYVTFKTNLEKQ